MEQIHLKVIQEHNQQLFELTGIENHLDHIYSAYLCREHIDDIDADYQKVCLYYQQEKGLKLKGLKLSDVDMGRPIQAVRREGEQAFRQALYFAILHELHKHEDYFIHGNWPYLAYFHLGSPDFKERFVQVYGAFELEMRLKAQRINAYEVEDENFKKLYREAINAYRFYTEGIC